MNHLVKIRKNLRRRGLDALLVTSPENRQFLSGYTAGDTSFTESSGALLIGTKGKPFLFTDFRYKLQAEAEAEGFEVVLYTRGLAGLLKNILPRLAIRRLGFESCYLSHDAVLHLGESLGKQGIELEPLKDVVEGFRAIKTDGEIDKIRRAVYLNEEVFQEVYAGLKPGLTEKQLALQIETTMRLKGAEGPSFETIVAAGPNGALPHAVPTDRPLKKGDLVVIDMGLKLDGYCSDMTRTVVLGRPDQRTTDLFRLVRRAQRAAIALIRDGVTARDVDRAARRIIEEAGHGKHFGHGLGHGVGLAVHEAPSLNRRSRKKLKTGMVVTVEPGIYLPGWGGIRLENMVVVRKKGCEVLNKDTTFLDI